MLSKIQKLTVFLLACLCFFFLADQALGLFGFPEEYPPQIAGPANFAMQNSNLEFSYEFRTNSRGIRYREIPLDKPESDYRVVVLGDSFVEGVGVPIEQTFPMLLEKELVRGKKETFFINCGIQGTSVLKYAQMLHHVGLRYHPDAVLIALYANDLAEIDVEETARSAKAAGWIVKDNRGNLLTRLTHDALPRFYALGLKAAASISRRFTEYQAGDQGLLASVSQEARNRGITEDKIQQWRAHLPPELVSAADNGKFNGALLSLGLIEPDYWTVALDVQGDEAEAKWRQMSRVLSEMIQLCRERQIPVAVVYVPVAFQYDAEYKGVWRQVGFEIRNEWLTTETEIEQRVTALTRADHVPFLNLTPYFRTAAKQMPGQLQYQLDNHWTPAGQQLAAATLAPWLQESLFLTEGQGQ